MRITLLFVFAILLTGCGAKELVVKNADNVISYQITKRIPLYSEQKDVLKKDVDKFLNKTKPKAQDMLPVLDELNVTTPNIDSQYKKLEAFYLDLSGDFSDMLARHMAKLDVKQQKTLFENLDQENREIKRRQSEKNLEKIEERVETILGTITKKQKEILTEYADYFQERKETRLQRRLKFHEELRQIYKGETSQDSKRVAIHDAFKKYQADALVGNKNLEIIKKMEPTLNETQREKLRLHIQEIKELVKYYMSVDY